MESLSAIGLASSIVQFVQFAGTLISQSQEIYYSTTGTQEKYIIWEDVAINLSRLSAVAQPPSKPDNIHYMRNSKPQKQSEATTQLHGLCRDCAAVTKELLEKLNKLKLKGDRTKWASFRQALSTVESRRDWQVRNKTRKNLRAARHYFIDMH